LVCVMSLVSSVVPECVAPFDRVGELLFPQ
jgi:hypothetical protein